MKQVLIALDQLAHTLIGGKADEALSAAAYRWELAGKRAWPRRLIDLIFFWDAQHCFVSYQAEMSRMHLPGHYRDAR